MCEYGDSVQLEWREKTESSHLILSVLSACRDSSLVKGMSNQRGVLPTMLHWSRRPNTSM